jgi:hypothetical protein
MWLTPAQYERIARPGAQKKQTYGDAMFLGAGDVDSLKKSCNNCRFILPYDVALPVFMDPLSKGCIMPAEYSAGKSALLAAFGGSIDTTDVRYQAIFTNFMNQRWGFTLSYYQYQVRRFAADKPGQNAVQQHNLGSAADGQPGLYREPDRHGGGQR